MNKKETEKDVVKAHICCTANKEQLKKVEKCGCFLLFENIRPKID